MENYAQIIVERHRIAGNRFYDTYSWEGDPRWKVSIYDYHLMKEELSSLPWPLRKIGSDTMFSTLYVRTDVPFWWITEAQHKARDAWRWFYYRLIATAEIWGLAYISPGASPSWRCLFKKRPF